MPFKIPTLTALAQRTANAFRANLKGSDARLWPNNVAVSAKVIAGAVWAAYELATFLLLFETIPEQERTSVLTTFNLANAIAMVCGSLLGGGILHAMGTNQTAYLALFAVSGVLRIFTLLLLVPAVRALPVPAFGQLVPVPTRVVAVRPNLGSIERPMLPGITQSIAAEASSAAAKIERPTATLASSAHQPAAD